MEIFSVSVSALGRIVLECEEFDLEFYSPVGFRNWYCNASDKHRAEVTVALNDAMGVIAEVLS